MYNLPSSYASSATTTSSTTTTSTSTSQQGEANSAPQLRGASAPTSLLDTQHGSAASSGYVPPGSGKIEAAFDAASLDDLRAMLEAAVANRDATTVGLLVRVGLFTPRKFDIARDTFRAAINAKDAAGDTMLMRMLKNQPAGRREEWGHHLWLLRLLQLGADVGIQDKDGNNAAMIAIRLGYPLNSIACLLSDDAIDHADGSGETALMTAVKQQNEGLVESLLTRGASPTAQRQGGDSALQLAWSDVGHVNDSIREMLRKAAPQAPASDALVRAALASSAEQRAFQAVRAGDREVLESLLREQPGLAKARTSAGHTLMMLAAIHGRLDIARLLLEKGACRNAVTASGETALLYAIRHGHPQLASWLIDRGAYISHCNRHGHVPLARAAAKGMASVVARLLENGADVEIAGNGGSLLDIAFDSRSPETVRAVFAHLEASEQGRKSLKDELLLKCQDSLMDCGDRCLSKLRRLLDAGVNANTVIRDIDGKTMPLIFVAQRTNEHLPNGVRVAELLIERGAALDFVDGQGRTALEIARQNGYQPMIDLLSGKASASIKS